MRDEKNVKALLERYYKLSDKKANELVEKLCDIVFDKFEELIDNDLPPYGITLIKNVKTGCIDILFELEDYENIVETIKNAQLLYKATDIKHNDATIEDFCTKMVELFFFEEEHLPTNFNENIFTIPINPSGKAYPGHW